MPEQDEDMNGSIWTMITKYGIGTVGFVVLLYIFLGENRDDQTIIKAGLETLRAEHAAIDTAHDKILDMAARGLLAHERVLWVLRVTCVNQADNESERIACQGQKP